MGTKHSIPLATQPAKKGVNSAPVDAFGCGVAYSGITITSLIILMDLLVDS